MDYCLICKRKITFIDNDKSMPDEATSWKTYGNYGSVVFDSLGGSYLEILICDSCLKKQTGWDDKIDQSARSNILYMISKDRPEGCAGVVKPNNFNSFDIIFSDEWNNQVILKLFKDGFKIQIDMSKANDLFMLKTLPDFIKWVYSSCIEVQNFWAKHKGF